MRLQFQLCMHQTFILTIGSNYLLLQLVWKGYCCSQGNYCKSVVWVRNGVPSGGTWRPGWDFRDLLADSIHWLSSHASGPCCGYVSGGHVYHSDKEALWWVSSLLTASRIEFSSHTLFFSHVLKGSWLWYENWQWAVSPESSRLRLSVSIVRVFWESLYSEELGSVPLYGDANVGRRGLVPFWSHFL